MSLVGDHGLARHVREAHCGVLGWTRGDDAKARADGNRRGRQPLCRLRGRQPERVVYGREHRSRRDASAECRCQVGCGLHEAVEAGGVGVDGPDLQRRRRGVGRLADGADPRTRPHGEDADEQHE